MRIATSLNVEQIPSLLDRFLGIIGPEPWIKRYRSLRQQTLVNPLLTPYFEDCHSLELRLGQLLDEPPPPNGLKTVDFADPQDYALFSFIAPVVLVFDQLTPLGRNRVAGILRDGLNTDLRPFKSEIQTITHLMRQGFDVTFQDIDHGRGFDFLAVRDGVELEVECKSASGDLGRQVHRRRMIEFSGHVQPVIKEALASEGGRLLRVVLPANLHGRREFLSDLAGTVRDRSFGRRGQSTPLSAASSSDSSIWPEARSAARTLPPSRRMPSKRFWNERRGTRTLTRS